MSPLTEALASLAVSMFSPSPFDPGIDPLDGFVPPPVLRAIVPAKRSGVYGDPRDPDADDFARLPVRLTLTRDPVRDLWTDGALSVRRDRVDALRVGYQFGHGPNPSEWLWADRDNGDGDKVWCVGSTPHGSEVWTVTSP